MIASFVELLRFFMVFSCFTEMVSSFFVMFMGHNQTSLSGFVNGLTGMPYYMFDANRMRHKEHVTFQLSLEIDFGL